MQFVAAKGTSQKELAALVRNPSWNFDEVSFCGLKYVTEAPRVGDLLGNRFTLALRFLQPVDEAVLAESVESLRESGFVNYFGLQRFGSKQQVRSRGEDARSRQDAAAEAVQRGL